MARSVVSKRTTRKQRARMRAWLWVVLGVAICLWGATIGFSHGKWGSVDTVIFVNNEYLDEGELLAATEATIRRRSWLVRRDRSWTLPRTDIKDAVMGVSSEIRSVDISFHKNQLRITLTLYEPHGLACLIERRVQEQVDENLEEGYEQEEPPETSEPQESREDHEESIVSELVNEQCWFMTHDGIVFERSPEFSLGVYPVVTLANEPDSLPTGLELERYGVYHDFFIRKKYDHLLTPTRIEPSLLDIRIDVSTIFGIRTTGYILVDRAEIMSNRGVGYLEERFAALTEKTDIPSRIAENPDQFEYLDVRFVDKVYVKFRD